MRLCLAMATADGGERVFPLADGRMVLGSDIRCDLRISLPSVSQRHCEIEADGDALRVTDLGSPGGTLRNGEPVHEAWLSPDDELQIGPVTFVVRIAHDGDGTAGSVAELKPRTPGRPAPRQTRPPDCGPAGRERP